MGTLDTKLVELVSPGRRDNPGNVKRVEFILTEENYEDLFPRHHPSYTYRRLLQAIAKFPAICAYMGREDRSDAVCRKTLATMFAHFTQVQCTTAACRSGTEKCPAGRQAGLIIAVLRIFTAVHFLHPTVFCPRLPAGRRAAGVKDNVVFIFSILGMVMRRRLEPTTRVTRSTKSGGRD